jgi:hypothetical protein
MHRHDCPQFTDSVCNFTSSGLPGAYAARQSRQATRPGWMSSAPDFGGGTAADDASRSRPACGSSSSKSRNTTTSLHWSDKAASSQTAAVPTPCRRKSTHCANYQADRQP